MSGIRVIQLSAILGLVVSLLVGQGTAAAHAQDTAPQIVLVEATGPVSPPFASYIRRGIDEADRLNAEAMILMLDTPGGSVDTTFKIIQDIRSSDVPVIVYVGPAGAKAASAGLLITLAGHAAAMAPETAIGASSPIDASGQDLPSTAQQKAEEYLSAQARALAERRGEAAVQLASDAVTAARAASYREAFDAGLVDFIANDVTDLLRQLDGYEVEVAGRARTLQTAQSVIVPFEMTVLESILLILTDPNIVALLLAIGPLLIIVEIRTPGGWVAGTLGAICTGLALYGLGVLPVNWLGIIFIVLALVLFVLEVTTPTSGALAAAAVTSMVIGAIILFNTPEVEPFGELSIPLIVGQSVILGVIFAFFAIMVVRSQRKQVTTGYEGLVGKIGRVTADIDPVGMVLVWGERWEAESEHGQRFMVGSEVKVVRARGKRLLVTTPDSQSKEQG